MDGSTMYKAVSAFDDVRQCANATCLNNAYGERGLWENNSVENSSISPNILGLCLAACNSHDFRIPMREVPVSARPQRKACS